MDLKVINLDNNVNSLCKEHPELIEILKDLGFTDITKPGMLSTAGRFMTIPKGAEMKKIPMETILKVLEINGFTTDK